MKKISLFLFLGLALSVTLFSQEPGIITDKYSGHWLGTLNVTEEMSLQIGFEFELMSDGSHSAKMNVIEQMAFDIPMDECRIANDSLLIRYATAGITYRGTYDPETKIISGTFRQGGASFPLNLSAVDRLPREVNRPQTPKRPFPYKEEDVSFLNKNDSVSLAGTLTMPVSGTKFPAVILIAGSGRNNRDETEMGHFLLLSDYLTRNGYAVLRYDKRGVGESTGSYEAATTFTFADDVLAAIHYLQKRPEINKKNISLIGHSEGALIAPIVASRDKKLVSKIILMGGMGLNGSELLILQTEKIVRVNGGTEEIIEAAVQQNAKYYAIAKGPGTESETRAKLREADPAINDAIADLLLSPWFRTFLAIDPYPYLVKVKCPVLAITGEKDLQCPPDENLAIIEKALKEGKNKHYTIKKMPGLNHLFQTAKTGSPNEYMTNEEIIAPEVLELIVEWLEVVD